MTTHDALLPAAVLQRKAVVYVRQSTQQVQSNLESQRRQWSHTHMLCWSWAMYFAVVRTQHWGNAIEDVQCRVKHPVMRWMAATLDGGDPRRNDEQRVLTQP
jgi:hypothetical protein